MKIPQWYECNSDKKLPKDLEHKLIEMFISSYQGKQQIIADSLETDFGILPLEKEVILKTEDEFKSVDFCRHICFDGIDYFVKLELLRDYQAIDGSTCLRIQRFYIISGKQVYFIPLNIADVTLNNYLFQILSIFDDKKITSPTDAYIRNMYVNKKLGEFIKNKKWTKIEEGLRQNPDLANALFIMNKNRIGGNYEVDFGTILYQLLMYRQDNISHFKEEELLELDKLMYRLRKTQLLRVNLQQKTSSSQAYSTDSALLECYYYKSVMYISTQFTKSNGQLLEESRMLQKII